MTPGRSRTQASATSSGEAPRPSAAVATASTMPGGRVVEVGGRRSRAKCGEAARESDGDAVPVLAGEHAPAQRRPRAARRARAPPRPARTSRSMPRSSSEYSIWVGDQRRPARPGALPGRRPARSASRRSWTPRRSGPGRWRRRGPGRTSVSSSGVRVVPAVHLPQVDVVGAEPRAARRPARRAGAPREASRRRPRRGRPGRRPWSRAPARRAATTSPQQPADQRLGSPSP